MDYRKIRKESGDPTLKDIERGYGPKVAQALLKYCTIKKLDIDEVVGDIKADGNGMTPWDKFDLWAQKTLGLDIMGNFDDTYDWTGAEERAKQEKERDQEIVDGEKELRGLKRNQKELTKLRKGLNGKKRKAKKFRRTYQSPTRFSNMDESSGGRMEENDILDWIYQEMDECEWSGAMAFLEDENAFMVEMPGPDGDVFRVSVTKVWSGRLGKRLD